MIKTKSFLTILSFALIVLSDGCRKDNYVAIKSPCPLVVSVTPANGATLVPVSQVIKVTFNEKMNPNTITRDNFTLTGTSNIQGALTYDENSFTLSFVPTAPLDLNKTYTGKVTTSVKDLMGNALQTDYIWTFSTGSSLKPVVISTDPANNATAVVLNKTITATFNKPMDPSTISQSTFIVKRGTTAMTGTVSYSANTTLFTPTVNLTPNTIYTCTITGAVKDTAGNTMSNDYTWSFTTGTVVAPIVTSTDPVNNETGVVLNKTISATFNMPMDPATLTSANWYVKQGSNLIPGSISYSGSTVTFKPAADLIAGLTYTATVTTGAKNTSGTPMANNYVWAFSTINSSAPLVISTDPANNASNVPLNQVVAATFNVNMDALTLNTSTYTVSTGGNPVSGAVSYSGKTVSFTPNSNLLSDATYTAKITTGAKDASGNAMANNYTWTFSTVAHSGPNAPDLKTSARFGILAGVGVSNNAGASTINDMDVGIYPGVRSSVTGFPPATVNNGAIYASDDLLPAGVGAMLKQAKLDLLAVYLYAEGATSPAPTTVSGDQGGKTLAPGIYKTTSTLTINAGDLTLDAKGDANAVWIFQVASGFTTVGGSGGNVILSGGAQAKNIYWQVGSSATIGDNTSFKGNILALTSITMNSHATAVGRMLAINGAVVMTSTNTINKP
jgi:hypothetical protein